MNEFSSSSGNTELLQNIVDNSPAIAFIWKLTEGLPVVYVSKNINQLGYTAEEFLAGELKFENIIHHDDARRVQNEVSENLARKLQNYNQKYRIIDKQGLTRSVRDWTFIQYDTDKNPEFAQGILLHITDENRHLEKIQQLSSFLMANPSPVIRITRDADIQFANQAGQDLLNRIPWGSGQTASHWRQLLHLASTTAIKTSKEIHLDERVYLFQIRPELNFEYVDLFGVDISDLQSANHRLSQVSNELPGALFEFTIHADGSQSIGFMNQGCESIWEISLEEIGTNPAILWEMIHSDDLPAMQESVLDSADKMKQWTHEYRIQTKSGATKWLSGKGTPTKRFDGSTSWTTILLDITEAKLSRESVSQAMRKTIYVLSAALEARDPYTAGHEEKVTEIAKLIAEEMGLGPGRITGLELAAMVHDVGKIKIPAEILSKPGKLTDIEYEIIKTHSAVGADFLKDIDFEWPIADIVRQHHERMDGSGYPDGLKGNEILLESRILAVADVVEAMSNNRPYRPGLGIDVAYQKIQKGADTRYDPEVAKTLMHLIDNKTLQFDQT